MCNAGHFNVEVDVARLEEIALEKKFQRQNIMGYRLENGRWVNVIAEGRLVNLASGDGHPAEIMDMSFAIQALCARYLVKNISKLTGKVIKVPEEIDDEVARRLLKAKGKQIDTPTQEQKIYMRSWEL